MRVYAMIAIIGFLAIYAHRDWFKALCGLILMMAFVQHPDFPNSLAGVQGANPWNLALASIVVAWFVARRREGLTWDMPRYLNVLLLCYLGVVLVGFFRAAADSDYLARHPLSELISEQLINTVKWVVPGLLLFDGCRNRQRFNWAIACVLGVYILLAIQVIRYMPAGGSLTGTELTYRARKIILNDVGYHPVNMSMMLGGAAWAILAALPLIRQRWAKFAVCGAALLVMYGQALTGGRMGYATWGAVGLVLCALRWRRYLLLAPLVVVVIAVVVPGAVDRMMQGFSSKSVSGDAVTNDYEVTSGRTLIWPYVTEKISESPLIGYGRLAMNRTGLSDKLWRELGESFPHPHNAYLECLLDNGALGFVLIMPFYVIVLYHAWRLFCYGRSRAYIAVGGMTLALVLALLIAAMGSQTFYPREGAVGMWAAIGLMLRMAVVQSQTAAATLHVRRPNGRAMPAAAGL